MSPHFVAFKKKNSKRYLGVAQAKPRTTKAKIRSNLSKRLPKGFTAKIINVDQALRIISRQRPRQTKRKK